MHTRSPPYSPSNNEHADYAWWLVLDIYIYIYTRYPPEKRNGEECEARGSEIGERGSCAQDPLDGYKTSCPQRRPFRIYRRSSATRASHLDDGKKRERRKEMIARWFRRVTKGAREQWRVGKGLVQLYCCKFVILEIYLSEYVRHDRGLEDFVRIRKSVEIFENTNIVRWGLRLTL